MGHCGGKIIISGDKLVMNWLSRLHVPEQVASGWKDLCVQIFSGRKNGEN